MATIGQLRKKAKDLGISPASIRKAKTTEDLSALIMDSVMNGGSSTTAEVSRPKRTAKKTTESKPHRSSARSAVKAKPAAQSATGKAKRTPSDDDDAGRNEIGNVDFNQTVGWNAREGSAPDMIIRALRKFKGNRAKVFEALRPHLWDYVGEKMRDGSKRSKASAEEMLRYRISRTAWDFAMKTGQHTASTNRIEYGTGGYGNGAVEKKAAKKTTKKAAASSQEPRRGPGRPRKAASVPKKATAATEAPKRRGRPPKKATATKATVAKKTAKPATAKSKPVRSSADEFRPVKKNKVRA